MCSTHFNTQRQFCKLLQHVAKTMMLESQKVVTLDCGILRCDSACCVYWGIAILFLPAHATSRPFQPQLAGDGRTGTSFFFGGGGEVSIFAAGVGGIMGPVHTAKTKKSYIPVLALMIFYHIL